MGLYVIMGQGDGSDTSPRRPRYIPDLGVEWSAMDAGPTDLFLVSAEVDAAAEAMLRTLPDVFVVPDLDRTVDSIEAGALVFLLGNQAGIVLGTTWRQAMRHVAIHFLQAQFAQTLGPISLGSHVL